MNPVAADKRGIEDGNDSRSAIDVAKLVQGHHFAEVRYRLEAIDRWDAADLDGGRIVFFFDVDGDPAYERRAILRYRGPGNGTELRLRILNQRGERIGPGVIRRPNGRTVEIWLKRWQLKNPTRYRMFVSVRTTASDGCADGCRDRVPNRGTIRHHLRPLCSDRETTIVGTGGDDVLHGTGGRDVIDGRGGNDEITGVSGSDVVCGRGGDDVIRGGRGWLFLRGGPGADHITATGPRPRPCDDTGTASCVYPEATLLGGAGPDVLVGGEWHENRLGRGGNDLLRGERRSDRLDGGAGHDILRGGRGTDSCKRGEDTRSCR
ncbi:MAG TPA: calcium-binding protein [Actinomycetota bacterium]|nr:calcium-binding protein [Actinomycetota bacterium]